MTTITLRQTGVDTADIDYKGAPLTNNEVDANFSNLLTQVQGKEAASANLSAIAALSPTNNNFIVGTGATFALESPASARTSLGLGTIATQNSNAITITGGSINGAAIGASTASTGAFTNLSVSGNLTVNGTTTTVNSTTVTVDDPVITLGGDTNPTSDDNKDRGVEFRYHDGSSPRTGFMGWDDSTGKFTLLKAATNTSEVFSGTKAELDANVAYSNITGTPTIGNGAMTVTAGTGLSGGGQVGTANQTGASSVTLTNADKGSSQNIFKNIAVSGQSTVVADTNNDTLTLVAGTNITITTNAATDSITINASEVDTLATVTGRGATTSTNSTFSGGINLSSSDITNGGTITATDFNTTSDMRLKDNITAVQNPLDILAAISGVQFNWKSNGKEAVGVLAQEIEKVLPQIVNTNADGYKAVSYDSLIPILIEAIKELAAKVK